MADLKIGQLTQSKTIDGALKFPVSNINGITEKVTLSDIETYVSKNINAGGSGQVDISSKVDKTDIVQTYGNASDKIMSQNAVSSYVATKIQDISKASDTTYGIVKGSKSVNIVNGVISVKNNSHNHTIKNVSGLEGKLTEINNSLSGKAASDHNHNQVYQKILKQGEGINISADNTISCTVKGGGKIKDVTTGVVNGVETRLDTGGLLTVTGVQAGTDFGVVKTGGDVTINQGIITVNGLSDLNGNMGFEVGYNENLSTLTNVSDNKRYSTVNIAKSESFSLDSNVSLVSGKELHFVIKNTSTIQITVTIPNTGNYVNLSKKDLLINPGEYAELNVLLLGKAFIRFIN